MATKTNHQTQLLQESGEAGAHAIMISDSPFLTPDTSAGEIAMTTISSEYEAMHDMTTPSAGCAATTDYDLIDIDPELDDMIAHSAPPPLLDAEPMPIRRTRSVSDKLNESAPVLFLKYHGQKMIGKPTPDEHERGAPHWTNWMVAISCSFFIMPSLLIIVLRAWNNVRMCIIFDAIYFIIVAICSFLSDYVYCWSTEKTCVDFVTVDQWTATGGVVIVIIGIVINPYPIILRIIDFGALLGAIYCIGKSRRAEDKYAWRKWHCIWHLFCGLSISG
eukprot:199136_1